MLSKMPVAPRAFRRSALYLRSTLHRSGLLQIAVLAAFWLLGEGVVRLLNLPFPGGIVGMAVVLGLLASGAIRPAAVRRGASWLLAEMLLFFVPAVMAVLDHREFIGLLGLKVAAVILVGTVLVMGGTALTVDLCYRWRARQEAHAEARHAGA